ncbi:MAG: GNAT family N-acetyltransferase [Oscillospiraceae bacterium]|jgi:RimJ/RimL family protein N-acetyltransferase|nr:GNAT family N-acetyltransferase [Oscillospiraceae bacterium]
MIELHGEDIYLAALERQDCKKICEDNEYDFDNPAETTLFGWSVENSDEWFEETQRLLKSDVNIRLGVFLNDRTVIGDVALQSIDRANRSCSLGLGIAKIGNRGKGYGTQALRLILDYGFFNQGFERIVANTTEINLPAQKVLKKLGFVLEGRERKALYFRGQKLDKFNYSLLADEYKC